MAFYFFAFCLQHWHETTNKHTNDTHCTGQAFLECVFVVVACAAIPAPSETHVLKLQWGSVCLETIDELCLRQIFHHHFSCLSLVSVYNCHPSPVNHVQSVRTNIKMMCVRVLWRFRMATFLFPSYSSRWFTVFFSFSFLLFPSCCCYSIYTANDWCYMLWNYGNIFYWLRKTVCMPLSLSWLLGFVVEASYLSLFDGVTSTKGFHHWSIYLYIYLAHVWMFPVVRRWNGPSKRITIWQLDEVHMTHTSTPQIRFGDGFFIHSTQLTKFILHQF